MNAKMSCNKRIMIIHAYDYVAYSSEYVGIQRINTTWVWNLIKGSLYFVLFLASMLMRSRVIVLFKI